MVRLRGAGIDPLYQSRSPHLLVVPRLRHSRSDLLSWRLGMAIRRTLFAGFWKKKLGILGALGLCFSMLATSTIIPFIPDGWAASAGGFPAMTERVAFLMKDLVLFGVSLYLLRQDVIRVSLANTTSSDSTAANAVEARRKIGCYLIFRLCSKGDTHA
jgi:hypothetical protein